MTPEEIATMLVGAEHHRHRADPAVGRPARRDRPRDWSRCLPRGARRLRGPRLPRRRVADRHQSHRPDHPPDAVQAAERPGGVHRVAEPARERQDHLRHQLLRDAPTSKCGRCRATTTPSASASGTRSRSAAAPASARRSAACAPRCRSSPSSASNRRSSGRCVTRSSSTPATTSTSWCCSATSIACAIASRRRAISRRACAPAGSRSPDSATVGVEYRVDRGPRTVLEVSGVTLPASLIAELEEAWHRNTFDQFLIDDLTHRVRRHLVGLNELGSVVVGTLDRPAPDTKRLRIAVTAGRRPERPRHSVYRQPGTVERSADGRDRRRRPRPSKAGSIARSVERVLLTAYNEAGFLKATVEGGPLTIDGDTGVLPFTIVEGPRAQVTARASLPGSPDERLPAVQKARRPGAAGALRRHRHRRARTRVERAVPRRWLQRRRRRGRAGGGRRRHRDADVCDHRGRRSRSCRMSRPAAARSRAANVMTEALRFELGKPVNLDEWALARKRLYDTNVFRLVDIQPVPIGDAVNGVQPVTARVAVRRVSGLVVPLRLPARRRSAARARRVHEHAATLGVVAELKNRQPVWPGADVRRVRHVPERQPGRDVVPGDVAAVRLAGALEPLRLLSSAT